VFIGLGICDIHFCQRGDSKKGNVLALRRLMSARIPAQFERTRYPHVHRDEDDMPEALQEHDGGKGCELYLNGLRHVFLPCCGCRL
jgi:hypothetical protein